MSTISLSLDEKWQLLPPGVRRRLTETPLPWLIRPLAETDAARARLLAWFDGGGLDRAPLSAEQVREQLAFYGDLELLDSAIGALMTMAPPARDYVIEHAIVIATGWSTNGWAAGALPAGRDRVIVLSGVSRSREKIRRLMLHEAAHIWLECFDQPAMTKASQERFICHLKAEGVSLEPFKVLEESWERRAELLASNWDLTRE